MSVYCLAILSQSATVPTAFYANIADFVFVQWKNVLSRLEELDAELAKPDLWEDAAKAG